MSLSSGTLKQGFITCWRPVAGLVFLRWASAFLKCYLNIIQRTVYNGNAISYWPLEPNIITVHIVFRPLKKWEIFPEINTEKKRESRQESSVSTVTRLWGGGSGVRTPAEARNLLSLSSPKLPGRLCGPPTAYWKTACSISPGVNGPEREADLLSPCAEVKNDCSYTALAFMKCVRKILPFCSENKENGTELICSGKTITNGN